MFTKDEIEFMKSIGLDCDFQNLPKEDEYWSEILEAVSDKLMYEGFDENYKPTEIGNICESIITKITPV